SPAPLFAKLSLSLPTVPVSLERCRRRPVSPGSGKQGTGSAPDGLPDGERGVRAARYLAVRGAASRREYPHAAGTIPDRPPSPATPLLPGGPASGEDKSSGPVAGTGSLSDAGRAAPVAGDAGRPKPR